MCYLVRMLIGFLLFLICQTSSGQTIAGTLHVSATVITAPGACRIDGVSNMLFPQYSALNAKPDDATGSITVSCLANTPYDIGLNQGLGSGATEEHRLVTRVSGKQQLSYGLFQDPNHKYNYGTIVGKNTLHQVGSSSPQVITIYGEIPAHQVVELGHYTDTVTLFVIF